MKKPMISLTTHRFSLVTQVNYSWLVVPVCDNVASLQVIFHLVIVAVQNMPRCFDAEG